MVGAGVVGDGVVGAGVVGAGVVGAGVVGAGGKRRSPQNLAAAYASRRRQIRIFSGRQAQRKSGRGTSRDYPSSYSYESTGLSGKGASTTMPVDLSVARSKLLLQVAIVAVRSESLLEQVSRNISAAKHQLGYTA